MSTKIKGSNAVRLDGESADRDLSGIAPAWVNFDASGTIIARDSVGLSSLTDNSTGNHSVNYTSAFANAFFSSLVTSGFQITNPDDEPACAASRTTSRTDIIIYSTATVLKDCEAINVGTMGDLA